MNVYQVYGAGRSYTNQVAMGFQSVSVSGTTVTFTLLDGKTAKVTVPTPADGKSIKNVAINTTNNHLICTLSDNSTIDAGELPKTIINISKESGNAIVEKADGLYVATTGVSVSAKSGNIIKTETDGLYAKADEIKKSAKTDNVLFIETDGLYVPKPESQIQADFSQTDNTKADFIKNKPVVDSAISATSTNAIQNKVVKAEIDKKVDISQGTANKGKALIVGNDGNVICGTVATESLTIVDKTKAQYNALSEAEKKDESILYNITDEEAVVVPTISKDANNAIKVGTDNGWYADKTDIATTFGATPSDSKVPSEKLVKDSLDNSKSSVKAIYDNGYASNNLIIAKDQTTTANGITYVLNDDGATYTLNGTATDSSNYTVTKGILPLSDLPDKFVVGGLNGTFGMSSVWFNAYEGITYKKSYHARGGTLVIDKATVLSDVPTATSYTVGIFIAKDQTLTNHIVKPFLSSDINATIDDFTPYIKSNVELADEIDDKADKSVIDDNAEYLKTKNLLDKTNTIKNYWYNTTTGEYIKYPTSGVVEVTGKIAVEKGNYYLSGVSQEIRCYKWKADGTYYGTKLLTAPCGISVEADGYIAIIFEYGTDLSEAQMEKGDVATSYQPYAKSNVEITEKISALSNENDDLKMLGWTVPSECPIQNYTDANGVFHQRVGRVDLGSLSWTLFKAESNIFSASVVGIQNTKYALMYSNIYNLANDKSVSEFANMDMRSSGNSAVVFIRNTSYSDADAFKSAMSGQYLYYELATEVTKSVDGNEQITTVGNNLNNLIKFKTITGTVDSNGNLFLFKNVDHMVLNVASADDNLAIPFYHQSVNSFYAKIRGADTNMTVVTGANVTVTVAYMGSVL